MLWWLRDLRYSVFGKVLLFVVIVAVIGGGSWFGFRALTTGTIEVDEAAVAAEQGDELVVPLTPMRGQCEQAKFRLRKIIESGKPYADPEDEATANALRAFAQAARTCTFNELASFDQEIIVPWVSGADMATILREYEAKNGVLK